jgi:hypothetical protein
MSPMRQTLREICKSLSSEWHAEERLHMKQIAWRYSDRAQMDGEVVRKTGEVIPRESA